MQSVTESVGVWAAACFFAGVELATYGITSASYKLKRTNSSNCSGKLSGYLNDLAKIESGSTGRSRLVCNPIRP